MLVYTSAEGMANLLNKAFSIADFLCFQNHHCQQQQQVFILFTLVQTPLQCAWPSKSNPAYSAKTHSKLLLGSLPLAQVLFSYLEQPNVCS